MTYAYQRGKFEKKREEMRNLQEVKRLAKLKPIAPDDIPEVARLRRSAGKVIVDKFIESEEDAALIELDKGEKARSVGWSAQRYVKKNKEIGKQVIVRVIGGNVYLQRQ